MLCIHRKPPIDWLCDLIHPKWLRASAVARLRNDDRIHFNLRCVRCCLGDRKRQLKLTIAFFHNFALDAIKPPLAVCREGRCVFIKQNRLHKIHQRGVMSNCVMPVIDTALSPGINSGKLPEILPLQFVLPLYASIRSQSISV